MKNKHRGEIVEKAIRLSGMSLTDVAKEIGYSRTHMYVLLDNPDMPVDIIVDIGKAIKHDFRKDLPELFITDPSQMVQEPSPEYSSSLSTCLKEKKELERKYYALLEENSNIKTELLNLKK